MGRTAWVWTMLLAACTGGVKPADDTGDTDETGGSDETGETADTGESGESGDTGGATSATVLVTGRGSEPLGLSIVRISRGDTGPVVGDALVEARLESDSVPVTLPTPDASTFEEIDPVNAPGVLGATFAPAAHADDGDGVWEEGEVWRGVSSAQLVFFAEDPPPEMNGMVAGWNVLVPGEKGPTPGSLDAVPLPLNLVPVDPLVLSGAYDTELGMPAQAVVAPQDVLDGVSTAPILVEGPIDAAWSLELTGEPPEEHRMEPAPGLVQAIEVAIAALDADASGSWSADEPQVGRLCSGTLSVTLLWFAPPTDLGVGLGLVQGGLTAGWAAYLPNGKRLQRLETEGLESLQLGGSCGG